MKKSKFVAHVSKKKAQRPRVYSRAFSRTVSVAPRWWRPRPPPPGAGRSADLPSERTKRPKQGVFARKARHGPSLGQVNRAGLQGQTFKNPELSRCFWSEKARVRIKCHNLRSKNWKSQTHTRLHTQPGTKPIFLSRALGRTAGRLSALRFALLDVPRWRPLLTLAESRRFGSTRQATS